jgi:hypothetical protein
MHKGGGRRKRRRNSAKNVWISERLTELYDLYSAPRIIRAGVAQSV